MTVRVQSADFDVSTELAALRTANPGVGALACFVGTVRDLNDGSPVSTLTLEHYPGMTEKALAAIVADARSRWSIADASVVHRFGPLVPTDQIVLVAVSAAHRGNAFDACRFIMDRLKTDAPFWKKESGAQGERWVDARESDAAAAREWRASSEKED